MALAATTQHAWRSCRGPTPPRAVHGQLLPLTTTNSNGTPVSGACPDLGQLVRGSTGGASAAVSPLLPGATPTPGLPSAPTPALSPPMTAAARTAGAAGAPGGALVTSLRSTRAARAAAAAQRKRVRWLQQRAAALVGVPDAVGAQGGVTATSVGPSHGSLGGGDGVGCAGGSAAAVGASAGGGALLDPISGRVVLPGEVAWQYEALGGGSVALELKDGVQEAGGGGSVGALIAAVRQSWVGACPVTGRPWKRVRALGPEHVPQVYAW